MITHHTAIRGLHRPMLPSLRRGLASCRRFLQRTPPTPAIFTLLAAFAAAGAGTSASASHCPADLNGDGVVGGADLGALLAGWGQPGPTDLDGNGITDGADLASLLAAWGACPKPSPTTFVGVVTLADGTPLGGAVVVIDLGGSATTGKGGGYELSLLLEKAVKSVTLTAVATIDGTTYEGGAVVAKVALGELNEVDPIVVTPQTSCNGGFAWLPGLGVPGLSGPEVRVLVVFDDGTGPALYAGGTFTAAGGAAANSIARWDGTAWSPLGSGILGTAGPGSGTVFALSVFDDGSGPALYVGGGFTIAGGLDANNIARWDGTEWSSLGSGVTGGAVFALGAFDDGTGPALYVGGDFNIAGGVSAGRIARWNGTAWNALGNATQGGVRALTVFDDGNGPALYAGGNFTGIGGVSANRIARWNGTAWNPLGSGVNSWVRALTVLDDGTGPALYAGGDFTAAGGAGANRTARWSGAAWSSLGGVNGPVYALTVLDDGTGPALYAGGFFTAAGGVTMNRIARWDGTAWNSLGSGMNERVWALTVFDDGTGPALYAGGWFTDAGGVDANRIGKWGCVD